MYELEFGFRTGEIQHMITQVPKILTASKTKLCKIFDYIHNTMAIPHSLIAKFPQVSCLFWVKTQYQVIVNIYCKKVVDIILSRLIGYGFYFEIFLIFYYSY